MMTAHAASQSDTGWNERAAVQDGLPWGRRPDTELSDEGYFG